MSRKYSLNTGCKVNLYLKILGKRQDGYHIIDSLFYPLSRPSDSLNIIEVKGTGLTLKCCPAALEHKGNILHKAYELYALASGFRPGLRVFLHKNVPAGAGLGGGSANAAAILLALNEMSGADRLDHENLLSVAARVGADVPFFLVNKPARVRGIGDILSTCSVSLKDFVMLLICPKVHVDTAWAYSQWDLYNENYNPPPSHSLTTPFTTDNDSPLEVRLVLSNSFEEVIFRSYPEIMRIKTSMLKNGAAACVMSGSGSSLIALFRDKAKAAQSCSLLQRQSVPFFTIFL